MDFIPESSRYEAQEVPFFDDVTGEGGWQGHTTSKSLDTLKSEVMISISRLGGLVTGFQRGTFVIGSQKREGFQVHYVIERETDGVMFRGRIDVAALPVKDDSRLRRSYNKRRERSLKMALYMLRNALDGTWFLQQVSPGYAPLMPWMLEEQSGKTVSQLWSESAMMGRLLPAGEGEFVEGEFTEEEE